jgi:NADPH:quinone reductase-like Zn-dependent oxidoreductase
LSHAEAAALPLAGLTAWQALVDTAQVAAGQRVLIHGAGGGVGHLAVQIAKARGAHVIGTASAAKHDLVASLGADELIDYRVTDFAAHVDGVDVVLDTIGDDIARSSIGVLHPGGLLVTIVGRRDVDLAARTRTAGRRFASLSVEPDYPAFEALAELAESGKLRVHLQAALDLAEAAKAPRTPRIRQCHRQDRPHALSMGELVRGARASVPPMIDAGDVLTDVRSW